jgi:hypothetical protein
MEIFISVLPIIIILLVWLFIMFRFRKKFKTNNFTEKQDEIISLLKEIQAEVKDLKGNNSEKKF